jgi:hypothetical protein
MIGIMFTTKFEHLNKKGIAQWGGLVDMEGAVTARVTAMYEIETCLNDVRWVKRCNEKYARL